MKTHPYPVTATCLQHYTIIFYLPPPDEPTTYQYFFGGSKTQYDKHISIGLLYMATPREPPE